MPRHCWRPRKTPCAQLDDDDVGADRPLRRSLQQLQDHAHLEPEFGSSPPCCTIAWPIWPMPSTACSTTCDKAEPDPQQLAELDIRLALWMQLARRYRRAPKSCPSCNRLGGHGCRRCDAAADLRRLMQQAEQAPGRLHGSRTSPGTTTPQGRATPGAGHYRGHADPGHARRALCRPYPRAGRAWRTRPGRRAVSGGGPPRRHPTPTGQSGLGGELSRLSLAIAVATSALGSAGTLIFDEVDSRRGRCCGRYRRTPDAPTGRSNARCCALPHLPQVAAYADQHYVVSKKRSKSGTSSTVSPSSDEARTHELARMLGGEDFCHHPGPCPRNAGTRHNSRSAHPID